MEKPILLSTRPLTSTALKLDGYNVQTDQVEWPPNDQQTLIYSWILQLEPK